MADYFDDEKDEPVAFEQDDEDDDFGNGYFIYADGRRVYGSDYDTAKKLDSEGKASVGASVAGSEPEPAEPLAPEPSNVEEAVEQEEEREEAPPPAAPAPLMQQALPAKPLPLAAQSRSVQQQNSLSRTQQGGASSTVSRTGSAVPQEMHEQSQRDIGGAYDRAMQGADDSRFQEAAAIAARAEQIEQMARDREAAASAALAQREQRVMETKKRIAEVSARPTDQNKIWKDKGVLGTVLGAIGVFLGGVSAYTMGRENTALKSIQEQKRQNIEAQLEDRNSELRGLERELGSLDAALPVFEARMNDAIRMRAESLLQDERSQVALANGRKLIQQLELEKTVKLAEAEKAYFGTIAQQQSEQSTLSTTEGSQTATSESESRNLAAGRGRGGPDIERALKLDKLLEEQGYDRAQRAKMLESAGLAPPVGKTSEEYDREAKAKAGEAATGKYTEAEGKAQSAYDAIAEYGKAAGLVRDPRTGEWRVGGGVVPPGFVESVNPFSSKPIRSRLEAAVEAYGRFQSGGVIGDEEREAFREQLGENTGNRQQLAERLNAAESTIRARRPREEREKGSSIPQGWR